MSELKWVVKTSSVRVGTERGDWIYHSLDDVPPALRSKIAETLSGPNCETILIANQEAYERVFQSSESAAEQLKRVKPIVVKTKPKVGSHAEWRIALIGGFGLIFAFWAAWLWLIQSGM